MRVLTARMTPSRRLLSINNLDYTRSTLTQVSLSAQTNIVSHSA
jgi:hypothetical protein